MKVMKISNLLEVGDTVYSTANGKPMKVVKIYPDGFDTEDDYYSFDEHKKLFFLTKVGYEYFITTMQKEVLNNDR